MITETSFGKQCEAAASDDLRILIVGAGIAGVSVAQLLRHQGRHPVLIERTRDLKTMTDDDHAGYMLALMPMVDPVLDALAVHGGYRERSVPLDRYAFHAPTGGTVRQDHLGGLLSAYGEYRGISRRELVAVLTQATCPVTFDASLQALSESCAQVTTGVHSTEQRLHEAEFDLVIIADGLGSRSRRLVAGGETAGSVDTAWGGWVAWALADEDTDQVDELWGDGFFLGAYPVKDGIGVFLGGPDSRQPLGARRFAADVRRRLTTTTPRIEAALEAIAAAEDPYYWPLRDFRSSRWTTENTVLLGDAAAGFLPTAGIGAGMAIESAHMLAAALDGIGPKQLPEALACYESVQRPRVEQAQNASRQLAGLMFHLPRVFAGLRSLLLRFVSLRTALGPIIDLLEHSANTAEVCNSDT
ncbi:MAG: FAD-dependent oxidoreductase [Brevibacterium sp.]